MPDFSPEFLDELRQRMPLYDLVAADVKLMRSGRQHKGLCPFHTEKTPSFTVYPDQRFKCFGCGAHGDLFAYVGKRQGVGFVEAVELLAGEAGVGMPDTHTPRSSSPTPPETDTWVPILPVPADAPEPTAAQLRCDRLHEYRGEDGRLLHYVTRHEAKGGKRKLPLPLTYGTLQGTTGWHTKAPGSPRPLYGLDRLAGRDTDTVMLHEGEWKADVGRTFWPEYIHLSIAGGTASVGINDLAPIARRAVIYSPDNDQAGGKAAAVIVAAVPSCRVVRVDDLPATECAVDLVHEDPAGWLRDRLPPEAPSALKCRQLEPILPHLLPPRPWAYGKFLLFGSAAVIGAVDGAGKGAVAVVMALAMITGKPLLGEKVWRTGTVAIVTYEDDELEWHRRIAAACQRHGLDYAEALRGFHFISKPGGRVSFGSSLAGATVFPDSAGIIAILRQIRAVGLIVDPFNHAHELDDGNSNVLIARIAGEMTRIAAAANVAVLVLHHLRKGSTGQVDDLMGATALRATFRSCRILSRMSAEEGAALNVEDTWRHLRVAGSKENYAPPPNLATWFRLESVALDNVTDDYPTGDSIGVATTWSPPSAFENLPLGTIAAIFDTIRAGPAPGERFTFTRGGKSTRWVGDAIGQAAGKPSHEAAAIIAIWREQHVLQEEEYRSKTHRRTVLGVTVNELKAADMLAPLRAPDTDQE